MRGIKQLRLTWRRFLCFFIHCLLGRQFALLKRFHRSIALGRVGNPPSPPQPWAAHFGNIFSLVSVTFLCYGTCVLLIDWLLGMSSVCVGARQSCACAAILGSLSVLKAMNRDACKARPRTSNYISTFMINETVRLKSFNRNLHQIVNRKSIVDKVYEPCWAQSTD